LSRKLSLLYFPNLLTLINLKNILSKSLETPIFFWSQAGKFFHPALSRGNQFCSLAQDNLIQAKCLQEDQLFLLQSKKKDKPQISFCHQQRWKFVIPIRVFDTLMGFWGGCGWLPEDKHSLKFIPLGESLIQETFSREYEITDLSKALSEAWEELTLFYTLGESIISITDFEKILQEILAKAAEMANASRATLMLWNEKEQVLEIKVGYAKKPTKIENLRFRLGEGIAGRVAKTGQPILENDLAHNPWFIRRKNQQKNILCVPLKIKGKLIGVLNVSNKPGKTGFVSRDLKLMGTLANQAAILIENAQLYQEMREMFFDAIRVLSATVDAKDPYTANHSLNVTTYACSLARELGLSEETIQNIYLAGLLHDIGKIGIPEEILLKPGKLTAEEYQEIMKHPVTGAKIIEPLRGLKNIIPMVRHHHERYDGTGYPDKLRGEEIPLEARILATADAFDALTSERPYRKAHNPENALKEIRRHQGTQFDPKIVEALEKIVMRKIKGITLPVSRKLLFVSKGGNKK